MEDESVVAAVRRWLHSFVVDLNLCPFAERELNSGRVRLEMTSSSNEQMLLQALEAELQLLEADPSIETTLLIHPGVLGKFDDYNQFLDLADGLIAGMQLEGVYQIASFHPQYQFAQTQPDDAENYTNRSPYPLLHLLRETSVENAVTNYPDIETVPARNIDRMNAMGTEKLRRLARTCIAPH